MKEYGWMIGGLLGGFCGLVIVRAFCLDPVQELGFQMFLSGDLPSGVAGSSTTMARFVAGGSLGVVVGAVLGALFGNQTDKD